MSYLKRLTVIILLGLTTQWMSCLEEEFNPDPNEPRLPRFSSEGNQVGGALINDVAWKTDFNDPLLYSPDYVLYLDLFTDSMTVTLTGEMFEGEDSTKSVDFIFSLPFSVKRIDQVLGFNNNRYELDGMESFASIRSYSRIFDKDTSFISNGYGELSFERVINDNDLNEDGSIKFHRYIMAGRFSFILFNSQNEKIEVTDGRYDFYLTSEQFDRH